MTQKTLQERIEEYKTAQKNINTLNTETENLQALIEQHRTDLAELQRQRDDLEVLQQSAADFLISGELSKDDFSRNKKTLSELYASIDETTSLLALFETKLERDYPKKNAELHSELTGRKRIVKTLLAENLAADIAEKSGRQIKELLALLPEVMGGQLGYDPLLDVGKWLGMAVFGGHYDSPKQQSPEEARQIVSGIYTGIGL